MRNHFATLLILLTALGPNLAGASKIQQQGIKTHADCVAAGATDANCLPLDSQIYDSTNAQQLSKSIANGQLGGGGGGKNYLASYVASTSGGTANVGNGDWELNATTGWSLAHTSLTSLFPTSTASAGTAFDSTHGGSAASGNLSLAIESTSPIQKKYSGKLVSSAASTAGDMLISNAFFIDSVDQTQPMTITLGTNVTAGATNLNFSGTSSNSFAIYVYDVTAGAWIQPAGVYGMVSAGLFSVKNVVFQPQSSTSTKYQLAFINVNASAGAYTLLLDAISVGPQSAVSAPAMSDMSSTLSFSPVSFGTVTNNKFFSKRIGDTLHVWGDFTTGTNTAGVAGINLPGGYAIDTAKLPTAFTKIGYAIAASNSSSTVSGSANIGQVLLYDGSTTGEVFFSAHTSSAALQKENANAITNDNTAVYVDFTVPISGWSSNTVSSADTDTRVVSFRAHGGSVSGGTVSNPGSIVLLGTVDHDSHAAYNTGTGSYTVPVSGYYHVAGTVDVGAAAFVATNSSQALIVKNGSILVTGNMNGVTGNSDANPRVEATILCKAGDTLALEALFTGSGGSIGSATNTYMSIDRVTGPAVVQASESVYAQYTVNAGSAQTTTGTAIREIFNTKILDSHNAMNSSTGRYTCPISGVYELITNSYGAGPSFTGGQEADLNLRLNNVQVTNCVWTAPSSVSGGVGVSNTCSMMTRCNQGDLIDVFFSHNGSGTYTLNGTSGYNNFSIKRVGN